MPKPTRKRTRVVIGGGTPTAVSTTSPSSTSRDGCWGTNKKGSGDYRLLLSWLSRHAQLDAVGVEGTGSYGAA